MSPCEVTRVQITLFFPFQLTFPSHLHLLKKGFLCATGWDQIGKTSPMWSGFRPAGGTHLPLWVVGGLTQRAGASPLSSTRSGLFWWSHTHQQHTHIQRAATTSPPAPPYHLGGKVTTQKSAHTRRHTQLGDIPLIEHHTLWGGGGVRWRRGDADEEAGGRQCANQNENPPSGSGGNKIHKVNKK